MTAVLTTEDEGAKGKVAWFPLKGYALKNPINLALRAREEI